MPSRYEPCGLNQLYSLAYGTVPVVRATGGLADTVVNWEGEESSHSEANGFSFREYSVLALAETIDRACDIYRNRPEAWSQLVAKGNEPGLVMAAKRRGLPGALSKTSTS